MRRCCDSFMVALNLKTATVKQCPLHCDVMLCPVCLQHKHRTTLKKANYCLEQSTRSPESTDDDWTDDTGDMLRHIVVTTPRYKGDVREAAERAAWWYNKLTRRKAWKTHVRASMAVFECTGNARVGWGWHVHVLTIGSWWKNQCKVDDVTDYGEPIVRPADPAHECECVKLVGPHGRRNYATLRCLAQEWHQVTHGEARIVHISAAGAHHRSKKSSAIAEAIKYVVKTVELDADGLVDFQIGMKGFQRIRWGGEWHGLQPPDDEAMEPRVMVCPDDLWRSSTGTIGELTASLLTDSRLVDAAAEAAGFTVFGWWEGPLQKGRARPPPLVKLAQAFAVAAVENLEQASDDLDTKTVKYFEGNPDRALVFTCSDVPF